VQDVVDLGQDAFADDELKWLAGKPGLHDAV